ncbi:class II aldolase/adducin family protein [Cohnella ginsengisoli]|uniref:Class II aldolase/adducin family protein n=1 Tax=Cohnella ginsengisoli TaxID=425004 RepID=A0A9X4QPN4_9BACL|nr:class II aldolase/adducin family protein [Cohnella ginsengisoli]MDG0794539.1 class II aldolase/adducin family protein [Cohnella ginsengisoli]
MNELKQLIQMSKYAGERLDLIQAGGGNSSVKFEDGTMAIKASGFLLSDLSENRGYSIVNNQLVTSIMESPQIVASEDKKSKESISNTLLKDTILTPDFRPSIETYLHALLAKYTLHTHPIAVNALTALPDWEERLLNIFGPDILLVEYDTPGIELALRLKKRYEVYMQTHSIKPSIVFLQNHGLIASSDSFEDIQKITEEVTERLEHYLGTSFARYRNVNKVSKAVNRIHGSDRIAYLSEDRIIQEMLASPSPLLSHTPYFPDGLVFLGYKVVQTDWDELDHKIELYIQKYMEEPKAIVIEGSMYLIAANVRKAKEMEDVLKLHLLAIQLSPGIVHTLPLDELKYLGNWEAEKFRQKQ